MGKQKTDFKPKPKSQFKKGEPRFVKSTKSQVDPTTKEMRSLYNKLMQNTKSFLLLSHFFILCYYISVAFGLKLHKVRTQSYIYAFTI